VYTTLKQFAGFKDGRCTVSLERIAITWGVTRRTVKRAIRKLRDFGLIRVKKNQASSTYTILKIPVPRSQSRGDKFVPSEGSQMALQRGHECPIDQTLFTRPSLPNDAPVDTSTRRGNSIALKRLKTLEEQIEKLRGEGARLIEQHGGFKGTRLPRVIEITSEIEELKRKHKILAIQLGV
jgi:biotin operon repressor